MYSVSLAHLPEQQLFHLDSNLTPFVNTDAQMGTHVHQLSRHFRISAAFKNSPEPRGDDERQFWVENNWWDPGCDLNENLWVVRIMRRFTFIASSMRKVSTHPVFLRRRTRSIITGHQQTAGSSGGKWGKKKESNLRRERVKPFFPFTSRRGESSCNCCLRKIISTRSSSQRSPIFAPLGVWSTHWK